MSDGAEGIGTLATGAVWANAVDPAAGARAGHDRDSGACANCGVARVGAYCHACGQLGHVHKNLAALVHDIAHGVFHFEGKVWKTLPMLAWHPGRLTRRYIDGERAKFVSPMALFLFSVFLMFAVVSNLARHAEPPAAGTGKAVTAGARYQAAAAKLRGLEVARAKATTADARETLAEQIDDARDEVQALSIAAKGSAVVAGDKVDGPRVVHLDTGWSWFDSSVSHMSGNPELTLYKLKTYGYKYSWALIPISLPFIWILFAFRRDVGLYDHAIFAIYSISFMSLGVVVLTLLGRIGFPAALTTLAVLAIPPVHMYRQLKGAYGLGRFGAGWRTAALLVVTAITTSIFLSFLFWMGSE